MKVYVSGCAGFIGSHICERLIEDGHIVFGVDNLATGQLRNVPEGVEFFERDISQFSGTYRADVVVHCAASYRDPEDWVGDVKTNALGTAKLVQSAIGNRAERFVYFQTSLCYGISPPPYPLTEESPVVPAGSYAVSKTAGEGYVRSSGMDYVSFRLANIYGPRNLSGPVPAFYKRMKAGQPCTVVDTRRDFVFVDDAVDVFVKAIYGEGERGVYHVSTGGDYPIHQVHREVVENIIRTTTGVHCERSNDPLISVSPRGEDDAPTILLDPSKAQTTFGWRATTDLADGVAVAVDYYEENGVGETFTHLKLREAA